MRNGGLAVLLLWPAACGAGEVADGADASRGEWVPVAEQALAASCAARQLRLRWPLRVRPMAEYEGGYTAGVGNVAWASDHAETWRAGWCAIGAHCPPAATAAATKSGAAARRFGRPRGLYSHANATVYVRDPQPNATTRSTVAHEVVHALQHQNFPALGAAHLWFNRDLSAAVAAAAEGDAHLVGWFFEPRRREHLCSMDSADAERVQRDWWGWTPHAATAFEGFPHVFGPNLVLARLLDAGTSGVDALLRDPPLSSLAVLRPAAAGPVDFIALPPEITRRVTGKQCAPGLANTVGAVGIWGLLAHYEAESKTALPDFLAEWAGDRFVHVVCDGERNDELAWHTRWRSAAAANEFARRFAQFAAAAAQRGGVLGAPARAVVRGATVLVATPGLAAHADEIARAPVRSFARYGDWIAADCFPHGCPAQTPDAARAAGADTPFACATLAPAPPAFTDWLARMRNARARAPELSSAAMAGAAQAAARLAVSCALNAPDNGDLRAACRAVNFGLRYLRDLAGDPHWRLLPLCASAAAFRAQLSAWLAAAEDGEGEERGQGEEGEQGGSWPLRELRLRGAGLAAAALQADGPAGLRGLAAAPPLSTLALLDATFAAPVDFFHLPEDALTARGCEVLASNVVGALGLWARLPAPETAPGAQPPPLVRAWRGDRQWLLGCGERSGWVWVSRWADPAAASDFAVRHLPALDDEGASRHVEGRTVWSVSPAFDAALAAHLYTNVRSRSFEDYAAWRTGGCFPRSACRE